MENEQEIKVSTEPKRRGRPPKAVEEKVKVASEAVQEIEETVSDNPVEVEQPKIITQTITQIIDEEPLEEEGVNIPEGEIFEVEEVNEVEDGYSVRYKYKRGEQVWVANWGHKLEGDTYGVVEDIYKYRPIKLTVKGFTFEDKLLYKFFGSSVIAEESHIKKNYEACMLLCKGLNG